MPPAATDRSSAPQARPLSPHLQVYRWQLTMSLSILHRMTGVGLAVGTLVLVWWLAAAATSPEQFALAQSVLGSWIGRVLLFGWTFALFYHLANGVRHLFWDAGLGFTLRATYMSGWLVVLASLALTVLSWVWGLS